MILSSSDILRILGADAIIRQEARLSVVEGRPGLDTGDSVYVYIDKFPTIDEFEATWKIWVADNSGMGEYVLNAMTSLLPNFDFVGGHYVTRDFASDRTVVKTEAEKQLEQLAAERQSIREDFSGLQEGLQARLSTVRDGRDGIDGRDGLDGRDGRDGADGRDGKDLDATEVELFDLKDVDESPIPLEKGQVLTWDGSKWTNLYVRQTSTFIGGGSSSGGGTGGGQINSDTITSDTAPTEREDGKGALRDGDTWWKSDTGQLFVYYVDGDAGQWVEIDTGEGGGGGGIPEAPIDGQQYARQDAAWSVVQAPDTGIPEAPMDGNYYVRQNGLWIDLRTALSSLGVAVDEPIDGGNFTTGFSAAASNTPADGGNFSTGQTSASNDLRLDGGNYTTGQTGADEFTTFSL